MWSVFRSCCEEFPFKYLAYHHFRAKGWVVRSGTKFGSDFLLYKHGPPFYHSSYSVLVERVSKGTLGRRELAGLNRVTESAAKELLLARVEEAESCSDWLDSPDCLRRMRLREVLVKRWVPSQEREGIVVK